MFFNHWCFWHSFSLGLQLQLHVFLLNMGKMNDSQYLWLNTLKKTKTEPWEENSSLKTQEFGESWNLCETQCVEVTWCCGYKVLDFHSEIWDLDSVLALLIKVYDKVKISQMWGITSHCDLEPMLHCRGSSSILYHHPDWHSQKG
jgi:hypothetical protein